MKRFVFFAAVVLALYFGSFDNVAASVLSTTVPQPYPLSGQYFLGTNEVSGDVDSNYKVTWTASGDLVHEEPENPNTHVFSIIIANGHHLIEGTVGCVMYTDEAKDGGVWENPDQVITLNGAAEFSINAVDGQTAWAAVKCERSEVKTFYLPIIYSQTYVSPQPYPLSGQYFLGTNEVSGDVDSNYKVTWTASGDLVHEEPENPNTHVFSIIIANGHHLIEGTVGCVMYTDEAKDGGVWENPDQVITLNGAAEFSINAVDGQTAWAAVKCERPR